MTTQSISRSTRWLLRLIAICFLACAVAAQTPSTFDNLAQSAATKRDAGRSQDAIRDYQKAVELKPDWSEGWWYLGTLTYEAGQFAEAQKSFERVVQLLPGMGAAWNFLGLCEYEGKDYRAAKTHLEKGQALGAGDDPDIARVATYHLALLRIKDGEFDSATSLLTQNFSATRIPEQIQYALGLALLQVPLLPSEVDPSQDALIHGAGEAAAAIAKGDRTTAIDLLGGLVQRYPNTPYLHGAYATQLTAANRSNDAKRQQQLEGTLSPEKARIAQIYANRSSATAASEGSEADKNLWREAMIAYTSGQYPQATATLKTFLQSKPTDGTAWAVLGLSEFELKDYDNAWIHLQRGRGLGFGGSPEAVQLANYRLGSLMLVHGQFESATALLTTRGVTGPLTKEVQFALGMALLRMSLLPDAVAPTLKPTVQIAGRISEHLHTSQYDEAFADFQLLLKQSPNLPFLHYAYGTALIALSRYDEAEVQMREELNISPHSELPYLRLASIAIRQHRPADALPAAQQALKLAPDSGEAHYLAGRAYLESGQDEDAVRELEVAGKIAPNSPEIHFNLAKAYTRVKLPEKAEEQRAIFVQLNAAAEEQKRHTGNGAYQGPREQTDIPSATEPPAPQ